VIRVLDNSGEPQQWFVCFSREKSAAWWVRALAWGRYDHVRAFAAIGGMNLWVFYDVNLAGVTLRVAREGEAAQRLIADWIAGADVLHVARRPAAGLPRWPVFSCVTMIKHLVGLPGGALRPDRLWHDLLAHGAKRFDDQERTAPAIDLRRQAVQVDRARG
jgi:hypothetical protein